MPTPPESSPPAAPTLNLPLEEFTARSRRLLAYIQQRKLAGAVLFDNFNVLYYSGFAFIPTERPMAYLLAAGGEQALFVPRLEVEHARQKSGIARVDHYLEYPGDPHPLALLRQTIEELGIAGGPIGVDHDGYPWVWGYQGPTLSALTGARVETIGAFLAAQQAVKSDRELALIKESCRWGNLAHVLLQRYTRPGETETAVSMRASTEATLAMIDTLGPLYRAQAIGGLGGAFAGYRGQIGRNSAVPHALTANAVFMPGDTLVTGANAPVWSYNSELERTMFIGRPGAEQVRLFDLMLRAQDTAFAALKPGARCSDVDTAVRSLYEQNGLLERHWRHHTGHCIGLRYHEGPFLDTGDHTVLEPGMVFTVEPGIYDPQIGGFRHSDTVAITENGIAMLTYYPRELDALIIAA